MGEGGLRVCHDRREARGRREKQKEQSKGTDVEKNEGVETVTSDCVTQNIFLKVAS